MTTPEDILKLVRFLQPSLEWSWDDDIESPCNTHYGFFRNPLTDGHDAIDLAAKLGLAIEHFPKNLPERTGVRVEGVTFDSNGRAKNVYSATANYADHEHMSKAVRHAIVQCALSMLD